MKKTARVELKVTPEWKAKVEKAAKDKNRSLNNFIETTVEEIIDKEEDQKWLES